jgi:hypothetical protein
VDVKLTEKDIEIFRSGKKKKIQNVEQEKFLQTFFVSKKWFLGGDINLAILK